MRRPLLIILLLALLMGCSADPEVDPTTRFIRSAVGKVSETRLLDSVTGLSAIHSRFMHWDPGTAATVDWLMESLTSQGSPAETDSFSYHRLRWIHTANVVSRFPGRSRPEEVIVVGAHWDSIDYPESHQDSSSRAPGTIDNATGAAAVVELARILTDLPLERSVKLVFFANEEWGMHGSRREAQYWYGDAEAESLVCMVNVDMLGWDADRADATLICDTLSVAHAVSALPWVQESTRIIEVDTLLKVPGVSVGASDHLQFWQYGLPAFWLHEGPEDLYPHANTDADSLPALDSAFLADGTRALVATVLHLAGPITD